jgi:hypothetical protein
MAKTKIDSLQIKNVTNDLQTQLDAKIDIAGYVVGELPSGTINGSNDTFTLANTPIADTERVIINGVDLERGASNDYTISGGTITFASPPETGDKIIVDYVYGATGGSGGSSIDIFTSAEFSHTAKTGTAKTDYVLAHNRGRSPDLVSMETKSGGIWYPEEDFYNNGTTSYSYAIARASSDQDSLTIGVYRISGSTETIRFKFYWFE